MVPNDYLTLEELLAEHKTQQDGVPKGEMKVTELGDDYDAVLADIENGKYDEQLAVVESSYTPDDIIDETGETRINKDHESRSSLHDLIAAAEDTADSRESSVKPERSGDVR